MGGDAFLSAFIHFFLSSLELLSVPSASLDLISTGSFADSSRPPIISISVVPFSCWVWLPLLTSLLNLYLHHECRMIELSQRLQLRPRRPMSMGRHSGVSRPLLTKAEEFSPIEYGHLHSGSHERDCPQSRSSGALAADRKLAWTLDISGSLQAEHRVARADCSHDDPHKRMCRGHSLNRHAAQTLASANASAPRLLMGRQWHK